MDTAAEEVARDQIVESRVTIGEERTSMMNAANIEPGSLFAPFRTDRSVI